MIPRIHFNYSDSVLNLEMKVRLARVIIPTIYIYEAHMQLTNMKTKIPYYSITLNISKIKSSMKSSY